MSLGRDLETVYVLDVFEDGKKLGGEGTKALGYYLKCVHFHHNMNWGGKTISMNEEKDIFI
jgi:hypothetical protein